MSPLEAVGLKYYFSCSTGRSDEQFFYTQAAACMYIQQLHFILLLLNEFLHCFYIYAAFSQKC